MATFLNGDKRSPLDAWTAPDATTTPIHINKRHKDHPSIVRASPVRPVRVARLFWLLRTANMPKQPQGSVQRLRPPNKQNAWIFIPEIFETV